MKKYLAGFLLVLLGAGCYSLDSASLAAPTKSDAASKHVIVSNYGWYLFNVWPIVCGNAHNPNGRFPWAFFRNDVTAPMVQQRLIDYAARQKSDITELNMFNTENILMEIWSIPIPIPYVLCYHEMQLSATLTPHVPSADAASARTRKRKAYQKLLNSIPDGGQK